MTSPFPRRQRKSSALQRQRKATRWLTFESLEQRQLLSATDMAAIGGQVYSDVNNNGFTAGEQVVGATVNLFRDTNNNGSLDAGDTALGSATTDLNGLYSFPRLSAADYFVQQPAQTVNNVSLNQFVSSVVHINSTDAQGLPGQSIDTFASIQSVSDAPPPGTPEFSSLLAAETLGGERDLTVGLTAGAGVDRVTIDVGSGLMSLVSSFGATGTFQAKWDGQNGSDSVDPIGLQTSGQGVDLTSGGVKGYLDIAAAVNNSGGTATVRVYTDANNYSDATGPLTAGAQDRILAFDTDFTAAGGTGADFANVGAIVLTVTTTTVATQAQISAFHTIGLKTSTVNFNNVQTADLSLVKASNNPTPIPGQNVTFTLNLKNSGPAAATGVVVKDVLPTGLTYVSSLPSQGTFDSATGLWTAGSVTASTTAVLQLTAKVTSLVAVTNTAEVTASDQPDPNSIPNNHVATEDDQSSLTLTPQVANLSLVKTNSNPTPSLNQNVTFTLNVQNAGPGTATGVAVADLLPQGLNFVSATPSQGAYNKTTGVWTVGTVANTSSATLQIVATVTSSNTITNTAEVTASDQPDPNSTPNNHVATEDDQSSITISPQMADLSLTKIVSSTTPNVNSNVTFTLNLHNAGPAAATNVAVTDLLPQGLVFVSVQPSLGSYNNANGVWTVGTMGINATASLALIARVSGAGAITNTAEVTASDQADPNSTPNNHVPTEDDQTSVTLNSQLANLSLTDVVDNATPNVGQSINFTITVANAGPSVATGVAVGALLPAGLEFVGVNPSQGTYDSGSGAWTIGSVAVAANATLKITAKVTNADAKSFTAQVTAADQPDPNSTPGNSVATEDDQATVQVTPQIADLSLTVTANPTNPNVGQSVTFTIKVSNAGPSAATGVVVKDVLPTGMTFVSSTVSAGAFVASSGTWTVGSVAKAASATLQLVAKVDKIGAKTNTAEVVAADQFDPNSTPGNNNATENDQASVTVTPQVADLALTKTVDKPNPNVGDNVTFTIIVSNAGPDGATGVVVHDLLPNVFTFVSSTVSQGTYDPVSGDWAAGAVANGASGTLTLVGRATQPGAQSNAAQISAADQFDPNTDNNQGSANLDAKSADLSLKMIVDNPTANVGDTVNFTITLNNAGPYGTTGVAVQDQLPAGLTFVSAIPSQGTYDSASGRWTAGALSVGTDLLLKLVAKVATAGAKTNAAEVVASDVFDPNSVPANNNPKENDYASAAVTPKIANLSLTNKVDNQSPNVNDNVTFTVTVSNAGPDAATGVVVTAPLPDGLTFVSATASRGSYDSTAGTWAINTIDKASNVTLALVATVAAPGTKTLIAEITASDVFDPNSTPNNHKAGEDDIAGVSLTPQLVDLALTAAAAPDPVYTGRQLTYTLTVTNAGPSDATELTVNDTLPEHVTFVSVTPSQGTAKQDPNIAGKVTASLGLLSPGAKATVIITGTVDPTFEGQLTNQAVAQARQFDSNTANNASLLVTQARLPPSRIAGTVYLDITRDGILDTYSNGATQVAETGMAGVLVTLSGTDRHGKPVNVQFVTGPDGKYEFTNLEAGQYTVVETQPQLFNPGSASPGSSQGVVDLNDPNRNTFFFEQLGSGVDAAGFNFGELLPVQVARRNYWAWS